MKEADVCLFLEGTYPYLTGGVSTWTHDLIKSQKHLTFAIVSILPLGFKPVKRYEIPDNVISISNVYLQALPRGSSWLSKKEKEKLFKKLELPLLKLQHSPTIKDLQEIITTLKELPCAVGSSILLDSEEAWKMLLRMYLSTVGDTSFLDFFWSFRSLFGGLYSLLLAELPPAKVYHSLCTGFAGLFLARAYAETGKPCLVTEHGIYTNERRIEIALAEWLDDMKAMNLSVDLNIFERDLKDYWSDMFSGYSKLCYQASTKIITLFEGNRALQIADGADPEKIEIIPNGIDYDTYSKCKNDHNHPPSIALIGRVVPIKDIKTYIRAVGHLVKLVPGLIAYIIGPREEDADYYKECVSLIEKSSLQNVITFTGKVDVKEMYPKVDVIVLSSLSEGQPLVILEAGAAGIPCVATNVGACREMICGRASENYDSQEKEGGAITPLANPLEISNAVYHLLTDEAYYKACSHNIQERVQLYYQERDQKRAYEELYGALIKQSQLIKQPVGMR